MRTTRTLFNVVAASALVLAACGDDSDSAAVVTTGDTATTAPAADHSPATTEAPVTTTDGDTREVVDTYGETIVVPAEPTSIVACGYAVLPLIQAEAALSAVCEWTRELDNMDAAALAAYEELPKVAVDGDVSTLNYEGVAAASPDLIILGVPAPAMSAVNLGALTALAPVVVLAPQTPGDWRELGERFAEAAGVADRYGESRAEYDALVAEINEEFADFFAENTFGAVCTRCGISDGLVMREFTSSYGSNLLDDLDAVIPGEAADGSHAEDVSLELVGDAFADVDVMVYGVQADGSIEEGMEELFESPVWQAIPAVQEGRVIEMRHHTAATYKTAILALESIREQLTGLAAG